MPKAGLGNLIALPLQGECVARGTTVFLDPTRWSRGRTSWAFLSSIARMSPAAAVTELAATLRPVDTGPTPILAELARQGGPPPPAVIHARLGAMPSIEARRASARRGGSVQAP
ncbi:MAG: TOTE conflict system archaeo-eukaryotic primase domain-containing protein, partial [Stackebrandtia sp.]